MKMAENTYGYILNFHRIKKIKGRILIVTEQGAWAVLKKRTYERLIRYELEEKYLKLLEEQGIIITLRNTDRIVNSEFRRKHFLFYPPSLHIVIPTLRCNQQCVYCHSSAKKEGKEFDMTPETAAKVVEFIISVPKKTLNIEIQGGEGLLNLERIKQIHDYAKDLARAKNKKINFSIVTNATLLNDEILSWVKENDIRLTTSLDGPINVHNKSRITKDGVGTYDAVLDKIKFCRKNGVKIGALMVTTRY
ncbi:radical SAM protein, partial [Candidatus Woesearchaeota archaeon]|nr:radical SAM protein [Candidatus Woesearchaeota archaeon]